MLFIKRFTSILFILMLTVPLVTAQDIKVHEMIGKPMNDVFKRFGKPVHQDKSNPAMHCVFYKSSTRQIVFVADKQGVYQAELTEAYGAEQKANDAIKNLLDECINQDCRVDTVNAAEFNLKGHGVKFNISLFQNSYSKKYEIRVKANRSEDK
ncbi:MAG: hypothetical protein K9J16_08845 [Melioribacteraceae bacterium]|nr:hypothetical protein [Melioribacteraceae bacterium]MCF8353974.1 hypothetical protein [Melioribacteraceae bacterium]MCF8393702.1 hypothetical protein [Melioribacteraceae bacterium]MCF8419556.1 hypothetical protein [Melioribacteraceae bacterium]